MEKLILFTIQELAKITNHRSGEIKFGEKILTIQDLNEFDFSKVKIVLSSAGSAVSKDFAPRAAAKGAIVIDNTSYFRMDPEVPLIVPEVNPDDIDLVKNKGIIANPNCSTAQMLVPLKPLHDEFGIKRIVVSTYQSVSGAGREAMDELYAHTKAYYEGRHLNNKPKKFTKDIAFNCIPHIDTFMEDGKTKEEWKMEVETKKILDKNIEVSATCVRVPVFVCHSESINIEFSRDFKDIAKVAKILRNTEGVTLEDNIEMNQYATPLECAKTFPVYVSRLRVDTSKPKCINMWVVADNVYGKGAALNSIQIAELLIKRGLV
jgi:aspartate-semialdehyde dehydrogenase